MAEREQMNSVKLQVQESALRMREFTFAQMLQATDANPLSVRTELKRLKEGGYLTSKPMPPPYTSAGKPRSIYKLVDDKEKLEELAGKLRSFSAGRLKRSLRPEGRHYLVAKKFLDRVATGNYQSIDERDALLRQADSSLEIAQYDRDEEETSKITSAFIQYEQGRFKFLTQDYEAAKELLEKAKGPFASSEEYSSEVAKIDQHLAVIAAEENSKAMVAATAGMQAAATLAALETIVVTTGADYPLAGWLRNLLSKLLREFSARERALRLELESLRGSLGLHTIARGKVMQRMPSPQHLFASPKYCRLDYSKDTTGMVRVSGRGVLANEYHCRNSEELELKVAVSLGSENPLSCSSLDLAERGRSKKDVTSSLRASALSSDLNMFG